MKLIAVAQTPATATMKIRTRVMNLVRKFTLVGNCASVQVSEENTGIDTAKHSSSVPRSLFQLQRLVQI
jgi:hypothetical protein